MWITFAFFLLVSCINSTGCQDTKASRKHKQRSVSTSVRLTQTNTEEVDLGYGPDVAVYQALDDAILALLAKEKPSVVGFGEFHKKLDSPPMESALSRFTADLLPVLAPLSSQFVLETWTPTPQCSKQSKKLGKKLSTLIQRPEGNRSELESLIHRIGQYRIPLHLLHFSCEEQRSLLKSKELDANALLESVGDKLSKAIQKAHRQAGKNLTIVYGGSTHNDKTPYPGLEKWSYVKSLKLGADFLEIDLYVPEFVQGNPLLSHEAWYPLIKKVRRNRVITIHRDQGSYIILLKSKRHSSPNSPSLNQANQKQ